MGTRFLLDTNAVIYYLGNDLPTAVSEVLDAAFDEEACISVISQIELLGWTPPQGKSLAAVEAFVNEATIYPLSPAVAQKAIEIRRSRKIKLPDAIIAATALVYDFTIVSRNMSDFSGIAGLTCLDPFRDL
jgi:predicted nucleic acid-binding protein